MPSLAQILVEAFADGVDRLDAQLLLLHALGTSPTQVATRRAWLLAHGDDPVPASVLPAFRQSIQRRAAGEPLAYITGRKEFFGLDLQVDARVLIPRPDTETLVAWALEVLAKAAEQHGAGDIAALDLGTGSGAIALALKHKLPHLQVDATDASTEALDAARANAAALDLEIAFSHGSWLDPVTHRYHCIVSNPPYVCAHDPHLAALAYEPVRALVSGMEGLDDIRHIVKHASSRLYSGAWLLLEHGYDQADAVHALFTCAGYQNVESRRDLAGHLRCTGGQLPLDDETPRNPRSRQDFGMVK